MVRNSKLFTSLTCGVLFACLSTTLPAEDIVTSTGKTYPNVDIVKVTPEGIHIATGTGTTLLKFTELPPLIQLKYRYDAYEVMLARTENSTVKVVNHLTDAFSLSQLEQAKAKAIAQKKPMGFVMVWGQFFEEPAGTSDQGGPAATAHFYQVFKDQLVLVYVRHENELNSVPEAVKKGFFGPDEGGFAPNMAVTDSTASIYVCEIPYGGASSNGKIRTKVFREGIAKIRMAQAQWAKDAAAAPVNGSSTVTAGASPSGAGLATDSPISVPEIKLFTLKSGEKIIGSIDAKQLMEGFTFINLSLNGEAPHIKTISDNQIQSITPATGEEDDAYSVALGNESQDAAWYQATIQKQLKLWLMKYPKSPHVAEMETKLKAFEDELYQVEQGNHRKGDQWSKQMVAAGTTVAAVPTTSSTPLAATATPAPASSTSTEPSGTAPLPETSAEPSTPENTHVPIPFEQRWPRTLEVASQMLYAFSGYPPTYGIFLICLVASFAVMYVLLVKAESVMDAFYATGLSGIVSFVLTVGILLFGSSAAYVYGYEGLDGGTQNSIRELILKPIHAQSLSAELWIFIVQAVLASALLLFIAAPLTATFFKSSWSASVMAWLISLTLGFLTCFFISSAMTSGDNFRKFTQVFEQRAQLPGEPEQP